MEDFANILERDYGLKPQGKLAPMSNVKSSSLGGAAPAGIPRNGTNRRTSASISADDDSFFGGNVVRSSSSSGRQSGFTGSDGANGGYDDVFGGPPKYTPSPPSQRSASPSSHIFEDIFKPASQKAPSTTSSKGSSSYPVFNAPIYDDDIFGGMPGIRSVDSAFEDVFNVGSAAAPPSSKGAASYDDLLGGFRSNDAKETINSKVHPSYDAPFTGSSSFNDLLPGFGATKPAKPQLSEDVNPSEHKASKAGNGSSAGIPEDPFAAFNSDNMSHTSYSASAAAPTRRSSGNSRRDAGSGASASSGIFVKSSPPDRPDLSKSTAPPEKTLSKEAKSGLSQSASNVSESEASNDGSFHTSASADDIVQDRKTGASDREKLDGNMPARRKGVKAGETDDLAKRSRQTFQEATVSPNRTRTETPTQSPKGADEFWISIDDVTLVTQPTAAPPPVRPPPVPRSSKQGHRQKKPTNMKTKMRDTKATENGHSPSDTDTKAGLDSVNSVLDDLEAFASGSFRMKEADPKSDGTSSAPEEEQGSAAATASGAAMKEAIERAEAKLRQAKEAKDRDKEEAKGTRYKEERPVTSKRDDGGETKAMRDKEEREREESDARERWRKEKEREEREREKQRAREREREREREKDKANEMARQRAAVDRANAEVREREAQKAAERAKAERAAVDRATAEARERHERTAVEKARAAEKAAAELEKERAAATAKGFDNDLESFFKSTSRPTSAPKQRTHPTDGFPASQQSNDGPRRNSNSATNVKKVPSMPSMVDDLTSLFGGTPAPGAFQEIEGESADRRRARWERYQRTTDRAAKALEEKHQRDLQSAKDQEERHRAGELVDAEIKRWAAGKEGNLRALLSSLQYVLWPECGWQPVSLTDLITAAAVKKVYRKATLYVHPDKVQQKGATNKQKYIAEKVFDLLKEAWNKFNAQELF